jgi:ATP-dependent exoDNAse (exonuclease V) alpha subunit
LVNGELVTVDRVLADGQVRLRDKRVLTKDYRRFVRGFAITSYASQGKTVDYVLFSDSAVEAATNQQQWYVTISRGRRGVRIFTSD